jgi:hypothetical protein
VAAAGVSGDLAGFASNGIDLIDSGATPPAVDAVTYSATPTFTATSQDQLFTITLTGNVTSSTLVMSGLPVPSLVTFEIAQDGTGCRTFVFPTNMVGGTQPSPAANAVTVEHFVWDGTKAYNVVPSVLAAIQANSITTLPTNVSITAGVNTTIITKSVTMPASGCPCRVFASYGVYYAFSTTGTTVAWVSDGTNTFGTSLGAAATTSPIGMNGSSFSTATYANSASVTFTLMFWANTSGGGTVNAATGSGFPGQNTWLNLAVQSSN